MKENRISALNSAQGWPTFELTNLCNLNCSYCYRCDVDRLRPSFLPLKTVESVLSDMQERRFRFSGLKLNWLGESTLHPQFSSIWEKSAGSGVFEFLALETNLVVLPEVFSRKISFPSCLSISIDTLEVSRFLELRGQRALEAVLHNIEKLLAARKESGGRYPLLRLQFVVMEHTEKELDNIICWSENLGISEVRFKEVLKEEFDCILFRRLIDPGDQDKADRLFEELKKKYFMSCSAGTGEQAAGKSRETSNSKAGREKFYPCEKLWTTPFVRADGTLVFCSEDPEMSMSLGNVNQEPFSELWLSEKAELYRKAHFSEHDLLPEKCSLCRKSWTTLPHEFFLRYFQA